MANLPDNQSQLPEAILPEAVGRGQYSARGTT